MQTKITPRILQGFSELLPKDQLYYDLLQNKIKETYLTYGFSNIDTPTIEYSDVLLAKAGGETEKQIYRFNHHDTDLSLRFDLTVPLARYVSMHSQDLSFPFKRSQIGKVYRGERPQKGRFREFYQCDADVIGSETLDIKYDAEMTALINDTFKSLNLGDFVIRINNRKILSGFFKKLNLENQIADILRIIDKIDKIGKDKVKEELLKLADCIDNSTAEEIISFISIKGTNEEILESISKIEANELFETGVNELKDVVLTSYGLGVSEKNIKIDLSIARGLDYYTGTVYETNLIGHENFGSVCSGGRYDNLTGYYSDKIMPGVGVSIGLTRLFSLLKENNMLESLTEFRKGCVILPMEQSVYGYTAEITKKLRTNGIICDTFWSDKSVKAKFKFADRSGFRYVIIIGESEAASGKVSIKDLFTHEQIECSADEAINRLK